MDARKVARGRSRLISGLTPIGSRISGLTPSISDPLRDYPPMGGRGAKLLRSLRWLAPESSAGSMPLE